MLFNSIHFILFFIIVTLGYFSLGWAGRWRLLLLASCFFYMVFKPAYILILFATIVIDYYAGIYIEKSNSQYKKKILIISLLSNIGILAIFKYYGFINANLTSVLAHLHIHNSIPSLNELFPSLRLEDVLPIGLSFHTFQAMSYTIEVYRGKQKAERHFGIYSLYVMFYPQLVAGPIERPQNILHQFHEFKAYNFDNIKSGLVQMAWGLFKKVAIADRLAIWVDYGFQNNAQTGSQTVLMAVFFYAFQIYCDFSGYSDMAIGAARVMGYDLMENFRTPYLATSIADFWRRWHISLSTWFRDYLYISLGGNKVSVFRKNLNLMIVFMVSGLWHGASWNFVIWGFLHGFYLLLSNLKNNYFKAEEKPSNFVTNIFTGLFTFVVVMFTWVFFRANGLNNALNIFKKLINWQYILPTNSPLNSLEIVFCFVLILTLMLKEKYYFNISTKSNFKFYTILISLLTLSYFFGVFENQQFIYFQF
ncbi:MAG: MBOAT family protein [Pseudarcicella sp.]|nr:MBOAT family protein [Pseudarcicella sp.]